MQYQNQEFSDVENKIQHYITIASFVVAIIAGFAFSQPALSHILKLLLCILIASAIWVIVSALITIRPRDWKTLIAPTENNINQMQETAKHATELDYFKARVNNLKNIVIQNDIVLKEKKKYAGYSRFGVYALLICSMVFAVIQILNLP